MKFLPFFRVIGLLQGLMLVAGLTKTQAQELLTNLPSSPKFALKTSPVHLEEINAALEIRRQPNRSWQAGLGYLYKLQTNKGVVIAPRATGVSGFSLRLSRRTYQAQAAAFLQGNYHGPLVTYRYVVFPEETLYDEVGTPRVSTLFQQVASLQYQWGVQRIFKNWLVLDGYLGLGGRVKYAYRHDPDVPENYKMRTGIFYGFPAAVGPDWAILLGPSVSLNVAIGLVL